MGLKTPLYEIHAGSGARIVDFGGWDMPLHYGSQLEEHHAVRRHAGAFDVSHMTVVDIDGDATAPFLRYLLANDVSRLVDGKALYSCMLNPEAGVIDDLIAYRLDADRFRLIVNAATRDKDIAWIEHQADGRAVRIAVRNDLAMVAVQGPKARTTVLPVLPDALANAAEGLGPFRAAESGDWFVGRTGYTGEDGFEVVMPAGEAAAFWRDCMDAGIRPCGLGARDTLRLEAGMNLYGSDMDESVSPLESGLAWTVAWQPATREFIGRSALEAIRATPCRRFVGLVLEDKGVLRGHMRVVVEGLGEGEITSGGFSPTLERSIAMARLPAGDYDRALVNVRDRMLRVRVVDMPFVRNGTAQIKL